MGCLRGNVEPALTGENKKFMKTAKCPECFSVLEIDEDLLECPDCNSLSRLVRWEPPTLKLVVEEEDERSRARGKERIKYEAEMAKLAYKGAGGGRADVVEIDISRPAGALWYLRRMDRLLTLGCGFMLLGILSALLHNPENRHGFLLLFNVVVIPLLTFCVWTGYRHVGVIDERVWGAYVFALPPLLLLCAVCTAGSIRIATGAVESSVPTLPRPVVAFYALYFFLLALLGAAGFVSVLLLRRVQVRAFGMPLVGLLSKLRAFTEPLPRGTPPARVVDKPRGILFGGAGAALILGSVILFPPASGAQGDLTVATVSMYVQVAGWIMLMWSRRYFQVEADSLLSVDKRRPILFLRSFEDDKRMSLINLPGQFLDFSLETRLSNHFKRFGPFVAVGLPDEGAPVAGAARVVLSNQEWLTRVSDWIGEASLIVMYAGRSNWVNWELAKIIEGGRAPDLVLVMPEARGTRASRATKLSPRCERLREVLEGTRWSESFAGLRDVLDVRAVLFRDDGSLVVIRSRPHGRDSCHLAVLVAHYCVLGAARVPV